MSWKNYHEHKTFIKQCGSACDMLNIISCWVTLYNDNITEQEASGLVFGTQRLWSHTLEICYVARHIDSARFHTRHSIYHDVFIKPIVTNPDSKLHCTNAGHCLASAYIIGPLLAQWNMLSGNHQGYLLLILYCLRLYFWVVSGSFTLELYMCKGMLSVYHVDVHAWRKWLVYISCSSSILTFIGAPNENVLEFFLNVWQYWYLLKLSYVLSMFHEKRNEINVNIVIWGNYNFPSNSSKHPLYKHLLSNVLLQTPPYITTHCLMFFSKHPPILTSTV